MPLFYWELEWNTALLKANRFCCTVKANSYKMFIHQEALDNKES